jgi:hypothetical protein
MRLHCRSWRDGADAALISDRQLRIGHSNDRRRVAPAQLLVVSNHGRFDSFSRFDRYHMIAASLI